MVQKAMRPAIGIALGAIAGFSYYHFIGCSTGACPISSNPYISTVYGAAIGFLAFPRKRAKEASKPVVEGTTDAS